MIKTLKYLMLATFCSLTVNAEEDPNIKSYEDYMKMYKAQLEQHDKDHEAYAKQQQAQLDDYDKKTKEYEEQLKRQNEAYEKRVQEEDKQRKLEIEKYNNSLKVTLHDKNIRPGGRFQPVGECFTFLAC